MKLSIVIVSWNTKDLTLKCVKSIFNFVNLNSFSAKGGPAAGWEVFLVDNASADKTIEEVQKLKYDNLYIITNKQNLGFAKANNVGIKQAQGEYILLLNPDTELIDNSLEKMIEFMDENNECGIVGPRLLNSNNTLQRSCRKFPSLSDQFFIQLKLHNFFAQKIKSVREYYMLDFKHDKIKEVDQVMGAAMLIRREVFDKIGFLDEKFWSVFEEVDFCKRAKKAGYKIIFYPDCRIMHLKGESFKKMASLKKQINFNQSLYYYFKKHHSFFKLIILWLLQLINLLLTLVDQLVGVRGRVGKDKDL